MENINPALVLLWDVLRAIECGYSVKHGFQIFLNRGGALNKKTSFQYQLETWWRRPERRKELLNAENEMSLSPSRRQLLNLIDMGLSGESIHSQLRDLEREIIFNCEEEISHFTALLPLKTMLPVMLCIFPSTLCLLVFPLLRMLQF